MRKLIYDLITTDPEITARVPADRWVQGSALLNTPERPYGVIRFGGQLRAMTRPDGSGIRTVRLEVWVHHDRGSFIFIDDTLKIIRTKLLAAEQLTRVRDDGSTVYLIQALWENDSPDMFDQDTMTNAKATIFEVVGSGW
jgi:hypothetical protein